MICDLAETYGIYDYKGLPVRTTAALVAGLRENSRLKMKLKNETVTLDTLLLATLVDRIGMIVWFLSEDGKNNQNRPSSIVAKILGNEQEEEVLIFESGEAFEEERKRLIGGMKCRQN